MSDLPTHWVPAEVEEQLYRRWVDAGYFTADPASDKPAFSVVIPPPNVTGSLHLGHALNNTLIDVLVRRKRMQGFEALWVLGMDHAGIATQTRVERHLEATEGKSRTDYSREEFLDKVWQWKHEYGGKILGQMRRLGNSVDWSRERFTMDPGLSRAVQTIFKMLYDQGLIYRAERLVNWSPALRSAISDIEVDYQDVQGELVSMRYGEGDKSVVVATTRVETMLGDTAVAVHPDDSRYAHLVGTQIEHPLTGRLIPIVADSYVDPEFGSGAVKITPAHDPNDFEIGRRHELPMLTIMDEAGTITGTGTEFDGMDRFEARVAVRERLAEQGRIVAEKRPYEHSVGHCSRTGVPIEPRLSLQWWVKVEPLAKASGDAVRDGRVRIHPPEQEPRWFGWVDDMHDWCISRQLWWGHRIPIYYGPDGEIACVGPDDEVPGEGWTQDPDVLDTWFSSALWPFSTLGWPERTPELERFYPTSVMVTGYDILFFWVARMMMFGLYAMDGVQPFQHVLLHGLIRDQFGKKMTKSKGNVVNPLEWVDDYGADATRFTLARGSVPGADQAISEEWVAGSRNFCTKLWNASRYALSNGANIAGELPPHDELTDADRWIIDRADAVIVEADELYERFQFGKACEALYHFVWDEYCDWYVELAKVQIAEGGQRAERTRLVLGHVLDTMLRVLHPVIPFVTERLWIALTGGESLVVAQWPQRRGRERDVAADERIQDVRKLVTEIRRFRSEQGLKPGQRVAARLSGPAAVGLAAHDRAVRVLAKLDEPSEAFTPSASLEVLLGAGSLTVELDLSGAIDVAAERKRLTKDLAAAEKELAGCVAKLENPNFTDKAPADVVARISERRDTAAAEVTRLTERLAALPQA
ncbi:valyl-tRNA synthetase [Tamaricihabitans halophyticus]|uniref:Valine--tRNA ligase n=1 Tax=Tamaricihabitans halophyticus TaxID=1262583 RepID=A0A4R2QHE6_9PSEU|nr:valyl-tRNA synthetase [Tamaricihabitans halophyticus]